MKLFQTIRENLASLGFIGSPFNKQHARIQSRLFLSLISTYTFAIHVANSPEELMDSFYIITEASAIFISYSITIFKMEDLFDFIDGCEKLYRYIESKISHKMQNFTKNQLHAK